MSILILQALSSNPHQEFFLAEVHGSMALWPCGGHRRSGVSCPQLLILFDIDTSTESLSDMMTAISFLSLHDRAEMDIDNVFCYDNDGWPWDVLNTKCIFCHGLNFGQWWKGYSVKGTLPGTPLECLQTPTISSISESISKVPFLPYMEDPKQIHGIEKFISKTCLMTNK